MRRKYASVAVEFWRVLGREVAYFGLPDLVLESFLPSFGEFLESFYSSSRAILVAICRYCL